MMCWRSAVYLLHISLLTSWFFKEQRIDGGDIMLIIHITYELLVCDELNEYFFKLVNIDELKAHESHF